MSQTKKRKQARLNKASLKRQNKQAKLGKPSNSKYQIKNPRKD